VQGRLGARHHPRRRRGGDEPRRKNQVAKGVPPRTLLAVDRAKRQAADGQRDDGSADPVERWRLALLAALRHVLPGCPGGHGDQWDVDEKRGAPRDRVDEDAADQGTKDGGRAGRARPGAKRPALLLAREVGGEDRKSTRLNSSHVAISYAVFCL